MGGIQVSYGSPYNSANVKITGGIITISQLEVGGVEDYLAVSSGGVLTLVGNAERVLTLRPEINIDEIKKQLVPDQVQVGVFFGYSIPIWNGVGNLHEELYFRENVPGRWDGDKDITIHALVCLAGVEDIGDRFQFQLSWNNVAEGSTVPVTTVDVTDEAVVVDNSQYATYELEFVVDWDINSPNVAIHDLLSMRLRRVAASASEITNEVIVLDWHDHYPVDKMFKVP